VPTIAPSGISRVTVIMPAYNASETVAEAVKSALAQTMENLEVVVVDDGSSEPVADSLLDIQDQRLRIIRTESNRGVSAARNTALAVVRSPVVAQLDADDFWRTDHLEGLLPALDDPAVGLAYSNAEIIGAKLQHAIVTWTPGDERPSSMNDRSLHPVNDLSRLYRVNPIPAPAVIMRTAAIRAIGGYPSWLTVGEEYYVYIKLRRAGWLFAYVDRPSAVYRAPEPDRGASYDLRHNARQSIKLFTVLALRSPNSAILRRLGGEIANLFVLYVPAAIPVGRRMRGIVRRATGLSNHTTTG
jgi:glycosyltransferase involved in cell wall biosynthesis